MSTIIYSHMIFYLILLHLYIDNTIKKPEEMPILEKSYLNEIKVIASLNWQHDKENWSDANFR